MTAPTLQPTAYRPQPDSLAAMVIGFFTNNPGEHLTVDDIADKFTRTRGNIHTLLLGAREAGLIARGRNADGEYIYMPCQTARAGAPKTAGPALLEARPLVAKAAAAPRRKASAALPDLATVKIDKHVPLPVARGQQTDWGALLARMEPADSCQLPLAARNTLPRAINQLHKAGAAKYTLRTDPDSQTLRVWRIA